MLKARVNIETAKKNYKPGEVIREQLSAVDMAFLRKHGFITEEPEDMPDAGETGAADGDGEGAEYVPCTWNPVEDGGGSEEGTEYMDEAALKKLSKDEIVEYAGSIGLEIAADILKNDMIDAVLNYTEERMAEV